MSSRRHESIRSSDDKRGVSLPTYTREEHDREAKFQAKSRPRLLNKRSFSFLHITGAFAGGILTCILAQYALGGGFCTSPHPNLLEIINGYREVAVAPPWVGSTTVHNFPPASPTNAFPSLFPTDVGFPGGTPTGGEAAVIATAPAYPIHSGAAQLVVPESLESKKHKKNFNLFGSWGNLSPWYSVKKGAFGVDSGPEVPDGCRVTGLHLLHRHGARYPHSEGFGGPGIFAERINTAASELKASGDLKI